MPQDTSARILAGDYRRGQPDSLLKQADAHFYESVSGRRERTIDGSLAYASTYYSALNDDLAHVKKGRVWYVVHVPIVLYKLCSTLNTLCLILFVSLGRPVGSVVWTLVRCETLSSILATMGTRFWFVPVAREYRSYAFKLLVHASELEALLGAQAHEPGDHTPWLLRLTQLKLTLAYPGEVLPRGVSRAVAEYMAYEVLSRLDVEARMIADPNQRARVYRGIGRVYRMLGDLPRSEEWYRRSASVEGIGGSTKRKSEAQL